MFPSVRKGTYGWGGRLWGLGGRGRMFRIVRRQGVPTVPKGEGKTVKFLELGRFNGAKTGQLEVC